MPRRKRSRVRAVEAKKAALGVAIAGGLATAATLTSKRVPSRKKKRRFRLGEHEPVSDGLARIALGQLDSAIERLEHRSDEDLAEAVHEARKSFKRVRAVVRLARDELGEEIYRRENCVFRDAGRRLSGARDSEVLLQTLDGVTRRDPGLATPGRLACLRGALEAEHSVAERRLQHDGVVDEVVRQLREARERIPDWPLESRDARGVKPGFKRIYRRARRAYRRARRDPSSENLHELRKRAKDLWYAAQILRPSSPKRMKRMARDAHRLSTLIGEDHDLAVLEAKLGDGDGRLTEPATGELAKTIERRRSELLREVLPLGKRLFGKKPRKVAKALNRRSRS